MFLKSKIFFGGLSLLATLSSCDSKGFYDQYQSVGVAWEQSDVKIFEVEQQDTIGKYNLFLNIRNNNDYPFNNLFVILKTEQPDKVVLVDTLEFQMANADGTLLGSGFTDIKENKLWIKDNFKFSKTGTYKFEVQQAVRQSGDVLGVDALKGITEVGFRIEKSE